MLNWSIEFETGVAVIDEDHRKLVEVLNALEQAINGGTGSQRVSQLLDFLEDYARCHFAREERCMEHFRCPSAQVNKEAHARFIAMSESARLQVQSSDGAAARVAVQLHRDLSDWIVSHILQVDSVLKGCVSPRPMERSGSS